MLAVAAIAAALGPLQHEDTRTAQALTLVVPVVAVAVLGGRKAAYAVAGAATLAFSLLLPTLGSLRVRLAEDLVALAVFSAVALVVGTVVARRIELLGEVERQRTGLLRAVSHDLRTPLSAIRAAASELVDVESLPPATANRFAEVIEAEAERLDRLVANLLSLSRIEAGAFIPDRHPVDVAELVEIVQARLGRLLRHVRLTVDVPADLPAVAGDYTQLDQLLTNLVENAARHTPAGATVEIRAKAVDGTVQLSVCDEGPGIDAADAAIVFEPFRSGPVPGVSGMGLAICKAVAEGHGGSISVGENPGGGAVLTVVLPVA